MKKVIEFTIGLPCYVVWKLFILVSPVIEFNYKHFFYELFDDGSELNTRVSKALCNVLIFLCIALLITGLIHLSWVR